MIELTPELRKFVTDPPAGSAAARAKAFGCLDKLSMTI